MLCESKEVLRRTRVGSDAHCLVRNFSGENPSTSEMYDVAFVWTDKALYPDEWPQTNNAVLNLVAAAGAGSPEALAVQAARSTLPAPVLVGFDTRNGPAVIGMSLAGFGKNVPGFRPHRVPGSVLGSRFGKIECRKHQVVRVDGQSISFRTGSMKAESLRNARITLIGCGAVGADVAVLLTKGGCNRFTLIDPDQLSWDNIGRHLLGAQSVGRNKAEAVGQFLAHQYPHVQVRTNRLRLETIVAQNPEILHDSDIIICLTGEWLGESALNVWAHRVRSIPVLFGWLEPHALAAHALLMLRDGGCLACARNESGEVTNRVIQWKDDQMLRVPACGGWFTPHGAADATPAKAMIAELAIDALIGNVQESTVDTYIASASRIKEAGGTIRPEWDQPGRDPNQLSMTLRKLWPPNPRCPQCK
jgi:sulfur-carrier protein adenylyltransferase/sulfurtransferase